MCRPMLCVSPIVSLWSVWPRAWPGAFGFLKNFTFLGTNLYYIIFRAVTVPQYLSGNAVVRQLFSGGSIAAGLFCASRRRQRTWQMRIFAQSLRALCSQPDIWRFLAPNRDLMLWASSMGPILYIHPEISSKSQKCLENFGRL